jgi:hypothetical protein
LARTDALVYRRFLGEKEFKMKHIKILMLNLLLLVGFVAQAQSSLPKGERLLSIDLTMSSDDDFGKAFTLAREAGMQVTSLSLAWDDLESSPGQYGSDPNWLEIANLFYSEQGVPISLTLTPIDTNNLRLPDDLKDKPFDDPEVIERLATRLMVTLALTKSGGKNTAAFFKKSQCMQEVNAQVLWLVARLGLEGLQEMLESLAATLFKPVMW